MLVYIKNSSSKGFTILELIILIVIGSVIILSIILVVPQIQKNQRDSRRLSDGRRLMTEVNNYLSTNPPGVNGVNLSAILALNTSEYIDPTTGAQYSSKTTRYNVPSSFLANADSSYSFTLNYVAKCDGKSLVSGTQNNYSIAISIYQETTGYTCISNN